MTSLLIIDDEPKMGGVLARMLARDGYEVEWTDNPVEAVQKLAHHSFDIIVSDLKMPEMSGLDVLDRAKRINPSTDFVMMTAYATPQTAVEAMKKGAIDYLIKPFAIEELKLLIKRIEQARKNEEPASPSDKARIPTQQLTPDSLIATSPQMQEVVNRVRKVAASNASVLLRGESGTGKEVFARMIHTMSARASGPLVMLNCGAIPENLIESELFGHTKGSFTGATESRKGMFESANGGSIFLDEIGEVPLHLQVKLLRALQEGEIQRVGESMPLKVDVRVIAATNLDLEKAVAAGMFRQDLYYRLNVIPIHLPPLRERTDDIVPLIQYFLRKFSPQGPPRRISSEALSALSRYDFPGNIRELENAIEHAVVLGDSEEIQLTDLPLQIQNAGTARITGMAPANVENMHLEDIEKQCILTALEKTRYVYTRAAAHLGITRRTLGYRIQKYGLEEFVEENIQRLRQEK